MVTPSVTVAEKIQVISNLVSELQLEDLPVLIGALEAAKAHAWLRLMAPPTPPKDPPPDHFITAEEAAAIASVPARRIYEWARGRKWAHRPTRRTLRIGEAAFRRWLTTRT